MHIIHIEPVGGVSFMLAAEQRRRHDVDVIYRYVNDPFRIGDYYGYPGYMSILDTILDYVRRWRARRTPYRIGGGNSRGIQFGRKVAYNTGYLSMIHRRCRDHRGIIHVHSSYYMLPFLRKSAPHARIIMHYHGTDRRAGNPEELAMHEKYADRIIVSTPDLLHNDDHAIWLPNPIDLDLFRPQGKPLYPDTALCITWLPCDTEVAVQRELNMTAPHLTLHRHDRLRYPVPYVQMSAFLGRYGYYLDVKGLDGSIVMQSNSMIGLQAQAVGCRTFLNRHLVDVHKTHDASRIARRLDSIYACI